MRAGELLLLDHLISRRRTAEILVAGATVSGGQTHMSVTHCARYACALLARRGGRRACMRGWYPSRARTVKRIRNGVENRGRAPPWSAPGHGAARRRWTRRKQWVRSTVSVTGAQTFDGIGHAARDVCGRSVNERCCCRLCCCCYCYRFCWIVHVIASKCKRANVKLPREIRQVIIGT